MRKLSKGNESSINKKIELMIKIIIRTDSYLNSANTKSTILLSLSSALIVALAINFDKITTMVSQGADRTVLTILITLVLLFLMFSIIFSLKGVTPYIKTSDVSNTFSFVDIASKYKELSDYQSQFTSVSGRQFLNELIALNHILSKALVSKYEKQITAITCIKAAIYVLCFAIYVIILANF